jgi:hypothetical protein
MNPLRTRNLGGEEQIEGLLPHRSNFDDVRIRRLRSELEAVSEVTSPLIDDDLPTTLEESALRVSIGRDRRFSSEWQSWCDVPYGRLETKTLARRTPRCDGRALPYVVYIPGSVNNGFRR